MREGTHVTAPDGEQFRKNARIHEDREAALKEKTIAESGLRKLVGGGEQYSDLLRRLAATNIGILQPEHEQLLAERDEADGRRGTLHQEYGQAKAELDRLMNDEEASRLRGEHANLVEQLGDTAKATLLNSDGTYTRPAAFKESERRSSQAEFMALALGESKTRKKHRTSMPRPAQLQVIRPPLIKVDPQSAV